MTRTIKTNVLKKLFISPPKIRTHPETIIPMTETANATGPVNESRNFPSQPSYGKPPPEPSDANAQLLNKTRAKTAKNIIVFTFFKTVVFKNFLF